MLAAERQREITDTIARQRSVRVSDLAKAYQVTEETIRRDLERLEAEGKLLRSHGGAVAVRQAGTEKPFAERTVANAREKMAIAQTAVACVQPGDSILFDASSTALEVARLLPDMQLTVLTNAINVAVELSTRPRIRVVCTGGSLSSRSLSFTGPQAQQFLGAYFVDHAFLSCTGVDIVQGLSDINESQALLKQAMMAIAGEVILLADHTKFGLKSLRFFGRLQAVHRIVTDSEIRDDDAEAIRALGITLSIAGCPS